MKWIHALLLLSALMLVQGVPLNAGDTRQEEQLSAGEVLLSWQQREIERTRKIVQIVKRVRNNTSCDRAIAAIRKLYSDARTEELLDPCPDADFSYEQLGNRQKRQFKQLIRLLRKELSCIYKTHVDSCSEHMYSRSSSIPRNRARSNSHSKISSRKFEELCLAFSDFVFVCDEVFPLDE